MIVLLVRHGETEHNLLGMKGIVGNDAPLNVTGQNQAGVAATICGPYQTGKIYSSPFIRCIQTANVIAAQIGTQPSVDERLKEFDMGDWAQLPSEQTKQLLIENDAWEYSPAKFDFRVPGGESWHDVVDRCREFLEEVKHSSHEASVVVSHNATLRAIVGLMRGKDFKDWFGFPFANGGVSVFEWKDDYWREIAVNKIDV